MYVCMYLCREIKVRKVIQERRELLVALEHQDKRYVHVYRYINCVLMYVYDGVYVLLLYV